ncbi:MAG: cytochrome b/b6 domain-containing protein [Methanocella sp.]
MAEPHSLWIKVTHWLHLLALLLLVLTGFQITYAGGFPVFPTMRLAREWHFYAMWLLLWTLVAKVYYLLATGTWRDTAVSGRDLRDPPGLLRYYLFLTPEQPPYEKYNAGQKLLYSLFPWVLAFQALTGFILYNPIHLEALWLHPWLLNLNTIRLLHYLVAWFFVVTVAVHLYLVLAEGWQALREMTDFRRRPGGGH